jgi:uncharacterized protein
MTELTPIDPFAQTPLPPAAATLYRLHAVIPLGILAIGGLIGLMVSPLGWLTALGGWLVWLVLLIVIAIVVPRRQARSVRWSLDPQNFRVARGIWFRSSQIVPRSRVQYVDLAQGPIERQLGLASLTLHTAGTQNASVSVSGLDFVVAGEIREALLKSTERDVV